MYNKALFNLGVIKIKPVAKKCLSKREIRAALSRHQKGDWGEVESVDRLLNAWSLLGPYPISSTYHGAKGQKIFIITNRDRTSTIVKVLREV